MRRTIFLTDLDDTLFCSMRKVTGPVGPAVTTAKNGHHSHMIPAQEGLWSLMRRADEVIPVTARSSDAFGRVHLDFGSKRAVLANGAVLLDDRGLPDPDWLAYSSAIGRGAERLMEEMRATIGEEYGDAVRTWIVREYDAPVYLCAKMNAEDPDLIRTGMAEIGALLTERFDLGAFQPHVNGNNLSLTPEGISKQAACAHLIDRLGDRSDLILIGVGDSLTDLPFMRGCDFMMTPSGSQIAESALLRSVREGAAHA